MERIKENSNFENNTKSINSQKETGKKNPKSKKIPNSVKKTFAEDNDQNKNCIQETSDRDKIQVSIQGNLDLSPPQKIRSEKGKTQKKPPLHPMTQANEGHTINRNRKLKSVGPKSKRNQYVYIVDPQSQKMKKYLVHQGEDIDNQLNKCKEYIPPFQSCDEDCESTEEIVQKGVQYSKKDLINEIKRRNELLNFTFFNSKQSQGSSSTDSNSFGK